MKALILAIVLFLASCGGTFTLSPTGSLSYTTPKIIAPQIQPAK